MGRASVSRNPLWHPVNLLFLFLSPGRNTLVPVWESISHTGTLPQDLLDQFSALVLIETSQSNWTWSTNRDRIITCEVKKQRKQGYHGNICMCLSLCIWASMFFFWQQHLHYISDNSQFWNYFITSPLHSLGLVSRFLPLTADIYVDIWEWWAYCLRIPKTPGALEQIVSQDLQEQLKIMRNVFKTLQMKRNITLKDRSCLSINQ